jgi:predicted O-linked N-acetylglucosamine transferase (SPINDLY family)
MSDNFDQEFALDARFYVNLGTTLLRDKQAVKEAIRAFQTALEFEPDCLDALLHLASCYLFQNRKREAKQILEQIQVQTERNDEVDVAYYNLLHSFAQLGRKLDDAIRSVNEEKALKCVLEIDPDNPRVLLRLATCYESQDRKQDQLKTIMRAIQKAKDPYWLAEAHDDLCWAYYMCDNKRLALKQIEILQGIDPERAQQIRQIMFDEGRTNTWENNWDDDL